MAETARSLLRLEHAVGRIPVIKGKGLHAKAVCDMLVRMRLEALPEAERTSGGGAREGAGGEEEVMIDELILVDRSSDLVTPMLSQLTYQVCASASVPGPASARPRLHYRLLTLCPAAY